MLNASNLILETSVDLIIDYNCTFQFRFIVAHQLRIAKIKYMSVLRHRWKLPASIRNGVLIGSMVIQICVHGHHHNFSLIFITQGFCKCSNDWSLAMASGNLNNIVLVQDVGDVESVLNDLPLPNI